MPTSLATRLAQVPADHNDTLSGIPGGGPNLDVVGVATAGSPQRGYLR